MLAADRLWIQREPPKPPRSKLKRKASTATSSRKKKAPRKDLSSSSKAEASPVRVSKKGESGKVTGGRQLPHRNTTTKNGRKSVKIDEPAEVEAEGGGRSRAAKTKANIRLDIQAKQLAATRAELMNLSKMGGKAQPPPPPLGTRLSRRLRGNLDDEWQQVPDEWLMDSSNVSTPGTSKTQGRSEASQGSDLGFDDESDLTELSDTESVKSEPEAEASSEADVKEEEEEQTAPLPSPPAGFIEWETVCSSSPPFVHIY